MVDYTKPTGASLEKIWAATGPKTPAPDPIKISSGWGEEIPPNQYFNFLDNKQDAMLAHLNQHGVPVWDNSTTYIASLSYAMGSNGIVYRAYIDSNASSPVNPVGDVSGTWKVAFYLSTEVYTKSEADGRYLTKAGNLSDLSNTATARNNLSTYSKAETDAKYTTIANNLGDVNPTTARNNLSVYSKAETDSKYVIVANNLSDVNAAAARANLGISSLGEANTLYTAKIANLSDVASIPSARSNLDVWSKAEATGLYALKANNLSDVVPATARANLDVYAKGESDTKYLTYIGNLAGLLDPITSFNNIKQAATDAYAGVSQFSSDAELLAGAITNKAIAPSKLKLGFSATLGINGHLQLPSWLLSIRFEWGRLNVSSAAPVNVTTAFPNNCWLFIPSLAEAPDQADIAVGGYITSNTLSTISYRHAGGLDTAPFMWFAIGN